MPLLPTSAGITPPPQGPPRFIRGCAPQPQLRAVVEVIVVVYELAVLYVAVQLHTHHRVPAHKRVILGGNLVPPVVRFLVGEILRRKFVPPWYDRTTGGAIFGLRVRPRFMLVEVAETSMLARV